MRMMAPFIATAAELSWSKRRLFQRKTKMEARKEEREREVDKKEDKK